MAAANWYPAGAGGSTGSEFATAPNLYTPGTIWYVSLSGTDAAAPAGKRREKPLRTTQQAVTNSAAGDIILYLAGFTETIAVGVTVAKSGLWFIGEGTGSSRPRLTCGTANTMIDVSAGTNQLFDNIYFPASTVAPTGRIRSAVNDVKMRNCYFECGAFDTTRTIALATGWGSMEMEDITFISTLGSPATQPGTVLEIINAGSGLEMDTVIFDGGASGWSASALLGTAAVTNLMAYDIDLLNDSVATIFSGSTGKFFLRNTSGNSEVIWTP